MSSASSFGSHESRDTAADPYPQPSAIGIDTPTTKRRRRSVMDFCSPEGKHALWQARAARGVMLACENSADEVGPGGNVDDYLTRDGDSFHKTIPRERIVDGSDREYMAWREVDHNIDHSQTVTSCLHKWIHETSDEDLASLILKTPRGVGPLVDDEILVSDAYDFTPWQRISMALYVDPQFDTTASVRIDGNVIRRMSVLGHVNPRRRLPINCTMSASAGSIRDFGIIDLPTASGKTAWALSVALMLLEPKNFAKVCSEMRAKRAGCAFFGTSSDSVARIVIVAAAATTYGHFTSTLTRLLPSFPSLGNLKVIEGSRCTMEKACEDSQSGPVIWFLSPLDVIKVLRQRPNVTVPMCIYDEFTQDTPRKRFSTPESQVLKLMILQATPQALKNATLGNQTPLKEFFRGTMIAPSQISRLIRSHYFKEATLAVEQLCKLDLVTVTPFRPLVRNELRSLVPSSLHITFVPSRRVTMASQVLQTTSDAPGGAFSKALLKSLRNADLNPVSIQFIKDMGAGGTSITPEFILDTLNHVGHASGLSEERQVACHVEVERVKQRVIDFQQECPICANENQSGMHIMGCCGYCMCTSCFERAYTQDNSRCVFCREPLANTAAPAEDTPPQRRETFFPNPPSAFDPGFMQRFDQVSNLYLTLHHAKREGCRRILVVVQRWGFQRGLEYMNLTQMSARSGVELTCVDGMFGRDHSEFTAVKRIFDSDSANPIGLISSGSSHFLVGTDFCKADCIVVVGSVENELITQALGRVFRPNPRRDNTKPFPLFRIYS